MALFRFLIQVQAKQGALAPGRGWGGGGWAAGFHFSSGSGGGFSLSGGFGGNSRKKARKRKKAIRAALEARARAELAARQAAHDQLLGGLAQHQQTLMSRWAAAYQAQLEALPEAVAARIRAARGPINRLRDERWDLYLISKDKAEIDGLIAETITQRDARRAVSLFEQHDPLSLHSDAYRSVLAQLSAGSDEAGHALHRRWQQAYIAAQEARLLDEAIRQLQAKSDALAVQYVARQLYWREWEAWKARRLEAQGQRREQIRHKYRVDEAARRKLMAVANTYVVPRGAAPGALLLFEPGRVRLWEAQEATARLHKAVADAGRELLHVAARRLGQLAGLGVSLALYSPALGEGSARARYRGVGLPAAAVGSLAADRLRELAEGAGYVDLPYRVLPVPVEQGLEIRLVAGSDTAVAVVQAGFDEHQHAYVAKQPSQPAREIAFAAQPAMPPGPVLLPQGWATTQPEVSELPEGTDARVQDCIVCFPEASGLEPLYLSFVPPVPGYLHIEGVGKAAGADFLLRASQPEGVAIPSAIADPLRGRAYATPAAVERAIWRTLGDIPELAQAFEPPNRARLALGLAPYAPRATWMGGRHHFELRIAQPSTAGSFDLDHLRMAAPSSEWGARHRQPMLLPWPISSGSRTWTPLVPPGSELLGPSELPAQPGEQAVYPGMEVKPGETVNTSLPAVEPGQAGASIPGFGEDDDLPESGLVFAGPPVVLGEVGDGVPMQQRSKGDGLQIDHMPSKAALRLNLLARQFRLTGQELNKAVINGASIAIPDIVHQSLSETYGGRNRKQKYIDSLDLRKAVDSNFNAIKPGLLEHGLSEAQAEQARAELHNLNIEKGWYE